MHDVNGSSGGLIQILTHRRHGRGEIDSVLANVSNVSRQGREARGSEAERLRSGVAPVDRVLNGVLKLLYARIEAVAKISELVKEIGVLLGE